MCYNLLTMTDEQKKLQIQVNVNVPEHLRGGSYANVFSVTTTKNGETGEVMIDFVFTHPSDKKDGQQFGALVSRIIMSLEGGIALKLLLESQLGKNRKE